MSERIGTRAQAPELPKDHPLNQPADPALVAEVRQLRRSMDALFAQLEAKLDALEAVAATDKVDGGDR